MSGTPIYAHSDIRQIRRVRPPRVTLKPWNPLTTAPVKLVSLGPEGWWQRALWGLRHTPPQMFFRAVWSSVLRKPGLGMRGTHSPGDAGKTWAPSSLA